ncbi:hypothetical protein F511_47104 [Dorcoceras hygrometricum]|uniref:Uncharacterized protein n=1 Tax=Dorcoceras hygrometricum TaxID=472368 RepID=A0A2Z6ZSY0_9LAMI|nr:hypothetical protein F511_47104 [Dorcoceras hygrometricum]
MRSIIARAGRAHAARATAEDCAPVAHRRRRVARLDKRRCAPGRAPGRAPLREWRPDGWLYAQAIAHAGRPLATRLRRPAAHPAHWSHMLPDGGRRLAPLLRRLVERWAHGGR